MDGKVSDSIEDAVDEGHSTEADGPDFLNRIVGRFQNEPALSDEMYRSPDELLAHVVAKFLGSGDHNGVRVAATESDCENLRQLIRKGQLQLVTTTDWMNPHIRPFLRADVERQVDELEGVLDGSLQACVYPTAASMEGRALPELSDQPYRLRLAICKIGHLEPVFFELAGLESYLNDPGFEFTLGDSGFRFADAPHASEDLDYDDLTLLKTAGYAYDHSTDVLGDEPIRRYWCALACDLDGLPPQHQQRLRTFELAAVDPNIEPHPIWWASMMGRWPEHIGPFDKVLMEMGALNEMWTLAFGKDLFRSTDRPQTWGWVLRSTTRDWQGFVLDTSNLIVDGISMSALDAAGAPRRNPEGDLLGSLARLEEFVKKNTGPSFTDAEVREMLSALRQVRKERQAPAHQLSINEQDPLILNRQRDLLKGLTRALMGLRHFLSNHPEVVAAQWEPPEAIDSWMIL